MWRIAASALLLAVAAGCSSGQNRALSSSTNFLFQPADAFFSTENAGGDPMPVTTQPPPEEKKS